MSGSTCPTGEAGMSCGFSDEIEGCLAFRATTLQILPSASIRPISREQARKQKESGFESMIELVEQEEPRTTKKSSWWWPGVVATTLAGAAAMAFRGCWHSRMSWPIGEQGYSYQVCLSCGAKRLFNEKSFCAYGPFRYDLNQLILWRRSTQLKSDTEA